MKEQGPATTWARDRWRGWSVALLAMGATIAILFPLSGGKINSTTVALLLLLVVLLIATEYGSRPAILAALMGVLGFNFFFLPPIGTLTISDPQNWVALVAFLITAIIVGQLSARARQRAEEAEAGKREIERLYLELREAFERASEAEALRRSEQLKSALLDAVTHDLRTPLTAIKVSATAMLDDLSSSAAVPDLEGQREMLDVINEEADRLNRFVDGLVELARIEAGALDLHLQWCNLEDVLNAALERAEPRTRGHFVRVSMDPELPLVLADARALAEAIYVLLENAAKYSAAGSEILVTARTLSPDSPAEIEIGVEDEGPGVPVEYRQRVFEKFFRAPEPARRTGAATIEKGTGGLGMGLAIAHGIIAAHGGSICIEDRAQGRGARFVVRFSTEDDERATTNSDRG